MVAVDWLVSHSGLAFSLFFIRVVAGLLIGKLVFDKDDDKNGGQTSSTNWGGMVAQDGVQKPVLEAIVMIIDRYHVCVCVCGLKKGVCIQLSVCLLLMCPDEGVVANLVSS